MCLSKSERLLHTNLHKNDSLIKKTLSQRQIENNKENNAQRE